MRFSGVVAGIFFLLAVASAECKIKVGDREDARVAGRQVQLLQGGKPAPAGVLSTSAEGMVFFREPPSSAYRVIVLAPGFAPEATDLSATSATVTIKLRVATAAETVVVTATRTPTPEQETASSISLLTGTAIETIQPTSGADALRFLPGAVVNVAGQRGGLGSLFVRGGDSRYNKVPIDGVPVTDPGGTVNASTVPLAETDRLEFLRGAQSTLYGSHPMTSVVQVFTPTGTTTTPELRFGADGGTFGTAHGFVSLAGARARFDYNAFADQFQTNGQGPNADYTNALQA